MSISDRAERAAPRDYELDTSFIQRPHHTDPRRLYSQTSTDWQQRVDHDRLRRDRLARARAAMQAHDLGGLIMFVGENIRYVTGTFQGNWKHNIFIRYAVLPRDGDPVLFETVGSDFECSKLDAPWLNGNIRPAFTWRWAEGAEPMMVGRMADSVLDVLREAGVENERIGIDTADMSSMAAFQERGLNVVNAWPAMSAARRIKTPDEIKGLYRECHDSLYDALAELKPGNTTADVASKFPEYDDDRYGSVSLQQFAHSIGLSLYEGMWVSRAYSLDYTAEIEENMYFAIETFAGHPGLQQTVRLEENVLVVPDGPVIFTLHPMDQRMLT